MRHKKNTKKFKRTEEERKRLWIDLTSALIKEGQITTFNTRAKWFTPKFERLVTLCKRAGNNEVSALRAVRPYLKEDLAKKLYRDITPKLKDRNGGYTRILKIGKDFESHDKSIVSIVVYKIETAPAQEPKKETIKAEKVEEVKEIIKEEK